MGKDKRKGVPDAHLVSSLEKCNIIEQFLTMWIRVWFSNRVSRNKRIGYPNHDRYKLRDICCYLTSRQPV
jgi:hypothetical protein